MTALRLDVEYRRFFGWTLRMLRRLYAVHPRTTLLVIAALALADITRLTATFLPLKIILLAGSAGVPRYLSFIPPEAKTVWISGLTVGAFAAYGLTLALEALVDQQARLAGANLLRDTNQLSLTTAQEAEAKRAFVGLTRLTASALVVLAAIPLLLWISPLTVLFLLIATTGWLSLAAWASVSPLPPALRLRGWLSEHHREYLTTAATLSFLGVFLVILAPFALGWGGNMALVLLVNIIVRQVLGNLSTIARTAIGLWPDLQRVDTLFFPQLYATVEPRRPRTNGVPVGDLRPQLLAAGRAALALPDAPPCELQLSWQDSVVKGVRMYRLTVTAADQAALHYQLQVYPPNRQDQLANEEVLLQHVTREQLSAATVMTRFAVGDLQCRICADNRVLEGTSARRQTLYERVLQQVLAVEPGTELVQKYRRSRPLLPDRLDERLFGRLEAVLDSAEEEQLLTAWLTGLPQLQQQLLGQPLALYNPDLLPGTVAEDADGQPVCRWGRWQIEPFGAVLQLSGQLRRATRHLAAVSHRRPALAQRRWRGDLDLAARCQRLERQIEREQFRAALTTIGELLQARGPSKLTAADAVPVTQGVEV